MEYLCDVINERPFIIPVVIFRQIFVSYRRRMWLRPNNKVRGNRQLIVTSFEKLMTSLSRPFPVFSYFRFSSHFGFYSQEPKKVISCILHSRVCGYSAHLINYTSSQLNFDNLQRPNLQECFPMFRFIKTKVFIHSFLKYLYLPVC